MPGLPEILDMIDEIRDVIGESSKPSRPSYPVLLFENFPLAITTPPIRTPGRTKCPFALRQASRNGTVSTKLNHPQTEKDFSVTFDVSTFKPEEISVKVIDRDIIIEGRHEEREDEHGFVSRQFTRKFSLPEEYDLETISTYLKADGTMTVKALKPKPQVKERIIPIKRLPESHEDDVEMAEAKKKKESEAESTVEDTPKEK